MIINEKSWHYRFIKFGENSYYKVPTSLCPYVRKIAIKLFLWAFIALMVSTFFVIIGTDILGKLGVAVGIGYWVGGFVLGAAVIAGTIGTIVGGCLGVWWLYTKYTKRKEEKKYAEMEARIEAGLTPTPPKTLMREWIDAKHDKLCPMLVFKNDKS